MRSKYKIIIVLSIIISILLVILCQKHNTQKETINPKTDLPNYILSKKDLEQCDFKPKLYYKASNFNIYNYCLENIFLAYKGRNYELKEFLKVRQAEIEDYILKIIDSFMIDKSIDGGEIISYDDGGTIRIEDDDITMIKCHTIDGNNDIYIGPKGMAFKSNFCDYDNTTFVRTYKLEKVNIYKKQQYDINHFPTTYSNSYEVTLTDTKNKRAKVIINNITKELESGAYYDFEFKIWENSYVVEDTIESLFKYADIVEIRDSKKNIYEEIPKKNKI